MTIEFNAMERTERYLTSLVTHCLNQYSLHGNVIRMLLSRVVPFYFRVPDFICCNYVGRRYFIVARELI